MTNEEIRGRAMSLSIALDEIGLCLEDRDVDIMIRHMRQLVTAALEEAAKMALDHDCKRDYCSAACVFGIGKAIRALKPVTP